MSASLSRTVIGFLMRSSLPFFQSPTRTVQLIFYTLLSCENDDNQAVEKDYREQVWCWRIYSWAQKKDYVICSMSHAVKSFRQPPNALWDIMRNWFKQKFHETHENKILFHCQFSLHDMNKLFALFPNFLWMTAKNAIKFFFRW